MKNPKRFENILVRLSTFCSLKIAFSQILAFIPSIFSWVNKESNLYYLKHEKHYKNLILCLLGQFVVNEMSIK